MVGLGQSGVAATLLLRHHAVPVYASDTGTGPGYEAWAAPLRAAGAAVQLGGHDLSRIGRAVAVVVAPGVPPEVAPLEAARAAGVPIYAEVDLGFTALTRTRCIGITGTNGKTTTTSLIAHLLAAAGLRAETAGNIGRPLCDVARPSDPPDWLALELSSFQLHDAPHLRPAIGVLTNLAPNHLDRYHSLEEYYGDKALLFRNADARLGVGDQRGRPGGGGDGGRRAGPASPLLDRAARPMGGTTGRAAGSCWATEPCSTARSSRSWATTMWPMRSPPRWSASSGRDRRADRGRAAHLPGHSAPGRAGARGRRRALDQRLQVHQRDIDRSRDRGAGPALRSAAGRPAQGRAL